MQKVHRLGFVVGITNLILWILLPTGCTSPPHATRAVYLLMGPSNTQPDKLATSQSIVAALLGALEPGDSLAVARMDSAGGGEKDVMVKATFDPRPLVANSQKRAIYRAMREYVLASSAAGDADIAGALLLAVEHLKALKSDRKYILIFPNRLKKEIDALNGNVSLQLDGIHIIALNTPALREARENTGEHLAWIKQLQIK
ncbi:hypothetical protein DSCO28_08770 [Desulfosarcina ovata subsp. sediminis]|uniref:Uncharacterized protein n=1 Tax=Desulfosarcina ovata subsp. sediminis TaxID=885957 RepID=A0A5K7ZHH6_9BACT|nr:VWA domain-containing protein [Desulfosarcina ovata]BBO80311.1 hypothetical protein DSCO28_08770 [Desulfosarcina ovata subsp. sediminis]